MNWNTKSKEGGSETENFINHDATFTSVLVYNDYQASGFISLVRATSESTTASTNNLRRVNHNWTFNDFRDKVANRNIRFLDEEGELVESNIDYMKEWFDQKRFISNHVTVRLIAENSTPTTQAIYLYDIGADVRKSYR